MPDPRPEVDRRRVRAGLTVLTLVLLVALVLFFVVDDAVARLVMAAVILFTLVRTALIIRKER